MLEKPGTLHANADTGETDTKDGLGRL